MPFLAKESSPHMIKREIFVFPAISDRLGLTAVKILSQNSWTGIKYAPQRQALSQEHRR